MFIEASNDYLNELSYKDDLLVNIVDYFTEKWNDCGLMKPFIFKNDKLVDFMKKHFIHYLDRTSNELVFQSYRTASSQRLVEILKDDTIVYNKRKLDEFLFVVNKINNKKLSAFIMKEYLYSNNQNESFFGVLENYLCDYKIFSQKESSSPNLILAASYFNHKDMLDMLLKDCSVNVNEKNEKEETCLHFGTH